MSKPDLLGVDDPIPYSGPAIVEVSPGQWACNLCCDEARVVPHGDHIHIECASHAVFIIRKGECLAAAWAGVRQ